MWCGLSRRHSEREIREVRLKETYNNKGNNQEKGNTKTTTKEMDINTKSNIASKESDKKVPRITQMPNTRETQKAKDECKMTKRYKH